MESLQTYLSSESEDESLDKRSKPNKENSLPTTINQQKPIPLPSPLPSPLLPKFTTVSEERKNEREGHGGRVRGFEHERGNWASFVSVNYEYDLSEVIERVIERVTRIQRDGCTKTERQAVTHTLKQTEKQTNINTERRLNKNIEEQINTNIDRPTKRHINKQTEAQTQIQAKRQRGVVVEWKGVVDEWHVSLSRTVVVLYHWMDVLLEELKENLSGCCRCTLKLGKLEVYCNDDKTRTFIGLRVHESDELRSYLRAVDQSLLAFDLPVYYQDPCFHVSVLWALGDVREEVVDGGLLDGAQEIFDEYFEEHPHMAFINTQEIALKMGNKVYELRL